MQEEFRDIISDIRYSFRLGVQGPVTFTTPSNHKSVTQIPDILWHNIQVELSAGRYSGPFSLSSLQSHIGPFRTSPLSAVPKLTPSEWRTIQDFSFPCDKPNTPSVNAGINGKLFKCRWSSFAECALLIAQAPAGAQVSINDIEKAYWNIPIHSEDQPHAVVHWGDDYYLDHCTAFSLISTEYMFTRPLDTVAAIYKHYSIMDIVKWVDDFGFWQYITSWNADGLPVYGYDEHLIFKVAERLGW